MITTTKQHNGSILCTVLIDNQLVKQVYYDYTKKEAIELFKQYILKTYKNLNLFEHYYLLPKEVLKVIEKQGEIESYEQCEKLLAKLKPLNYTFDYYLDAVPYNLRKI